MDLINGINADWVDASRRLSPRLLIDLAEKATNELAACFWFHVGRECTGLWHHQQQIRLAVRAACRLADPCRRTGGANRSRADDRRRGVAFAG